MNVHRLPSQGDMLRARRRTQEPMTRLVFGRLFGGGFATRTDCDQAYERYLAFALDAAVSCRDEPDQRKKAL